MGARACRLARGTGRAAEAARRRGGGHASAGDRFFSCWTDSATSFTIRYRRSPMGKSMRGLFITATDTGAGKTFVDRGRRPNAAGTGHGGSCLQARRHGAGADGMTAVGRRRHADSGRGGGRSRLRGDHALGLSHAGRSAGGGPPGRRASLRLEELTNAVRRRAEAGGLVLVEGIGGLLCPLTEAETVADWAAELGLPLVVVARRSLGTLNHTLLTLEVAHSRRLAGRRRGRQRDGAGERCGRGNERRGAAAADSRAAARRLPASAGSRAAPDSRGVGGGLAAAGGRRGSGTFPIGARLSLVTGNAKTSPSERAAAHANREFPVRQLQQPHGGERRVHRPAGRAVRIARPSSWPRPRPPPHRPPPAPATAPFTMPTLNEQDDIFAPPPPTDDLFGGPEAPRIELPPAPVPQPPPTIARTAP